MGYTQEQIQFVTDKIIEIVFEEINISSKNGTLFELLKKYEKKDVYKEYKTNLYIQTSKAKILVLGDLSGQKRDYIKAAKIFNIEERQLEFETDYENIKHYDVTKLKNSNKYSDIFIGPIPHKMLNMGDVSNFIAEIESDPENYPKLYKASANGKLKFTISNFRDAINDSLLYYLKNEEKNCKY